MIDKHQKMIESFRKRYAHGLDTWSTYSYLKECIRVFLDKYDSGQPRHFFEVGIGSGISSEQILEKGHYLTGIDVAENKNWRVLREKWGAQFDAAKEDIISYRASRTYDVVVDNGCFHHLEPELYGQALANIIALMHPESLFLLAVFREDNAEAAEGHVEMIDAGMRRCKFFTQAEITRLLRQHQLVVADTLLVPRNFNNAQVMVCICKSVH